MAYQVINTGTEPNDGTGDTARASFTKINQNFAQVELDIAGVGAAASAAQQTADDAIAQLDGAVAGHLADTSNPHGVTKSQVGLGNVDNVSAADLRDRSTHTGTQAASTITGLAAVATSGSYNDLDDTPTVQSSPTDTTAGALMTVGAFGLGAPLHINSGDVDSLDDLQTPGLYSLASSLSGNPALANAAALVLQGTLGSAQIVARASNTTVNKLYFRSRGNANGWQDFVELWHTGNLLGLIYQGDLGASQDLDTYRSPGMWRQGSSTDAGSGSNYPIAEAGWLYVAADGPTPTSGIVQEYHSTNSNRRFSRTYASSAWSNWKELLRVEDAVLTWLAMPVGVAFPLWDHLDSTLIPPANDPRFRYIKLTAGDSYNSGVLTSETVTGSAPLITAQATVSLAGSPINGAVVALINTERTMLRPKAASTGAIQDDAIQNITGTVSGVADRRFFSAATGPFGLTGSNVFAPQAGSSGNQGPRDLDFDASRAVRTADETRGRTREATYYMRIL